LSYCEQASCQVCDYFVGADQDLLESSDEKHMFQLVLAWCRENIDLKKPRLEDLTEQVHLHCSLLSVLALSLTIIKRAELNFHNILTFYCKGNLFPLIFLYKIIALMLYFCLQVNVLNLNTDNSLTDFKDLSDEVVKDQDGIVQDYKKSKKKVKVVTYQV
jgi:hypothetical protein